MVALNLGPDGKPTQVNKFARVAEADAGLDREAAVLEELSSADAPRSPASRG